MGKLRWATSEAILQHIGRVYFRRQRVYVYHIFYPDGTEYRVLYDWLWFGSDYTHFHPELDSRGVCYCSSPHMIITAIHDGVTRGGGPGSKPRQFSIKTMIYVMGKSLAEWEDLGNCSHAPNASPVATNAPIHACAGYGHEGQWRGHKLIVLNAFDQAVEDATPFECGMNRAERMRAAAPYRRWRPTRPQAEAFFAARAAAAAAARGSD